MGKYTHTTTPLVGRSALPALAEAVAPPEHRGLRRDALRLLVTGGPDDPARHARVADLDEELRAGDVLVVNRSATLPSSLPATGGLRVHLSTRLGADRHVVELRRERGHTSSPWFEGRPGMTLDLPDGESLVLEAAHPSTPAARPRLWIARGASLPLEYLLRHGRPIQYDYTRAPWKLDAYQTVFGVEPGSAEMPSASRGFTRELVERLRERGVVFAPITLHCGVASLEAHEPPHEEYARVEQPTLDAIALANATGARVVAVGTTAMRALASARRDDGSFAPFEGLTDALLGPGDDTSYVDGLISGFHPPEASHLQLLASMVSREHLAFAYSEAAARGYLSHEFGDAHLMWRDVGR